MRSSTVPAFWQAYRRLEEPIRQKARKTYRLWQQNPFHPSLHFKCVNHSEGVWSVRISRGYRALGIMDRDSVVWFWIGGHDDYERLC